MKMALTAPFAMACLAFGFVLEACSSSGSPISGNGYAGVGRSFADSQRHPIPILARGTLSVVRPDRGKSRISSELKSDRSRKISLFFVSDAGTNDVYILKLPKLTLLGTLTGFDDPEGECSDRLGDVWITDSGSGQVFEYSHSGTLINTLSDSAGTPISCAWDKTTGNLAVLNQTGSGSTAGNVLIYPDSSGTPAEYSNPNQYYYFFASYDNNGNLFFDGQNSSGYGTMLSELPMGASSASTLNVSGGTIYFPGMVAWSQNYVSVGDQACDNGAYSCVYHVSVGGSTATITGRTNLLVSGGGQIYDLVQGAIFNKKLVGSDNENLIGGTSATYSWRYPAGGSPTWQSTVTENFPQGGAVSK